ncbi:hypothetical protein LCGC14_0535320 [marine sediment metagenome]|uniref:Uncharacterized protein n=1 Tax=marine sediment metagenome TaxID=412755 RepID=A0A0F9V2F3_9ZZZZ
MAYTYDITTSIGQVRRLINDTDITPTTDAQFNDEEISFFLDLGNNSVLMAASYALESWAAAITGSLKSEKIGDYSYTKDEASKKIELAKKYSDEAAAVPYMTWSEWDLSGGSSITAEED